MSKNNANEPISVAIFLGSLTTDNTLVPAMYLPKASRLVSAHVIDGAGIAADNTNYITLSLKNGSTVLATLDSRAANEGALTANVAKAMTVDSTKQDLAAGSTLTFLYHEAATEALTNAQLILTYFPY
jgi:hypothetical protein